MVGGLTSYRAPQAKKLRFLPLKTSKNHDFSALRHPLGDGKSAEVSRILEGRDQFGALAPRNGGVRVSDKLKTLFFLLKILKQH